MEHNVQDVADQIEAKIKLLEAGRKELQSRSDKRAKAIGDYERILGLIMMKLNNGIEYTLDGVKIQNPPATITEKIARAICYQSKINMEKADTEYKLAIKAMDALQAELNGWQSINKFLAEK